MLLAAIAAIATVLTLAMPLLVARRAEQAHEVGRARAREDRASASASGWRAATRSRCGSRPSSTCRRSSTSFNLNKWVGQEEAREQAGAGRLSRPGALRHLPVLPHGHAGRRCSLVALFYLFVVLELDQPPIVKIGICLVAAYVGMQLPYLFLKNQIAASASFRSSAPFPDALDLLLICVESGMSIEAGFKQGQRGDRLAVDRARRGADADHRRAVLSAGPPAGLREPRQAHRPRRREVGLHGAAAGRALRHAARRRRCA